MNVKIAPVIAKLAAALLLLCIGLLCLVPRGASAQGNLCVLDTGPDGVAPAEMLYTYLRGEAQAYFEARQQAIQAVETPEDVRQRAQRLREQFVEALGGFPERTPLNPRVVGTLQRDGYTVERVLYESRPHHHVTAVLYLPKGEPPYPGVLYPLGHKAAGKAAEDYQRAAILMAKNGLAVLAYDPIGQGERAQLLNEEGGPLTKWPMQEHVLTGVGALLVGWQTATHRIWDGMRGLDYLASRPDIDAQRLGVTGNSGGGTLTSYLMALDDRVAAAAPSCWITSMERLLATLGPQDAEQNITGQIAFGLEHADYLTMHAPKPTLVLAATRDFFDIEGTWTSFREAKRIYGLMGYGKRLGIFEYNDTHGHSKPRREAGMRWMRRWLLGKDDAPSEGDVPLMAKDTLHVTSTGQVLTAFDEEASVFDVHAERAAALARRRAQWQEQHTDEELRTRVRRMLALPDETPLPEIRNAGTLTRDGYAIDKLIFETEEGIWVPALLFTPEVLTGPAPLTLYLQDQGKAADAQPGGAIEALVREGARVLALDLRGMGETRRKDPVRNWGPYVGKVAQSAFLSLDLGRPLLGQRVYDVLSVLDYMAKDPMTDRERIDLVGIGRAGPIALHAAALDERVAQLTMRRAILSWTDVVETPANIRQLANAVPGALEVYDLPELVSTLAPRPVTIERSVNPAGQELPEAALEAAYAPAQTAYRARQAAEALVLSQQNDEAAGASAPITITHTAEGYLFAEGRDSVLLYRRRSPHPEREHARGHYIHPLYGAEGTVLTEDAPADHLHQHGLFWAWHQVFVGGTRVGDGWTQENIQWDVREVDVLEEPAPAALRAHVFWTSLAYLDDEDQPEPFVEETTTIRAYPAADGYREIDFVIKLRALADSVRLGGSEDEKGYGGFSARVRLPEDVRFSGPEGPVTPKRTAVEAGPWMHIAATFAGEQSSGLAILQHPSNPGYPQPWILRREKSMQNAKWPGATPVLLPTDEPLALRYRLVVYQGDAAPPLEQLYARYAASSPPAPAP